MVFTHFSLGGPYHSHIPCCQTGQKLPAIPFKLYLKLLRHNFKLNVSADKWGLIPSMQALYGKLVQKHIFRVVAWPVGSSSPIVDESAGTTALSLERQRSTERVHHDKHIFKIQAFCKRLLKNNYVSDQISQNFTNMLDNCDPFSRRHLFVPSAP